MRRPLAVFVLGLTLSGCAAETDPPSGVRATQADLKVRVSWKQNEAGHFWFQFRQTGTGPWTSTTDRSFGPMPNTLNGVPLKERLAASCGGTSGNCTVATLSPETAYEYRFCGYLTAPNQVGSPSNPICFDSAGKVGGTAYDGFQTLPYTVVAAGDVGDNSPRPNGQDETGAQVVQINPDLVLAPGDLAYSFGTLAEFQQNYDPWWGSFKAKTRPVPGNHEQADGDAGYDAYFGPGLHNYSFDLGNWHIVGLDTNNGDASAAAFLRADLATQPASKCLLAYWHHPLHSSGLGYPGGIAATKPLNDEFFTAGGDVLLAGHEHNYERFGLQTPLKQADPGGYRAFVVGTGGQDLRGFAATLDPNSEVRLEQHGVLKLALKQSSYKADFVGVSGASDNVPETSCHS